MRSSGANHHYTIGLMECARVVKFYFAAKFVATCITLAFLD